MEIKSVNYFYHKVDSCGHELGDIENLNDFKTNQPFINVGNDRYDYTLYCDNNHESHKAKKENCSDPDFYIGCWKVKYK